MTICDERIVLIDIDTLAEIMSPVYDANSETVETKYCLGLKFSFSNLPPEIIYRIKSEEGGVGSV